MKQLKKAYEAPTTEVIALEMGFSVLTGSPVTPDAGITGSGFQFGTDNGNW